MKIQIFHLKILNNIFSHIYSIRLAPKPTREDWGMYYIWGKGFATNVYICGRGWARGGGSVPGAVTALIAVAVGAMALNTAITLLLPAASLPPLWGGSVGSLPASLNASWIGPCYPVPTQAGQMRPHDVHTPLPSTSSPPVPYSRIKSLPCMGPFKIGYISYSWV